MTFMNWYNLGDMSGVTGHNIPILGVKFTRNPKF